MCYTNQTSVQYIRRLCRAGTGTLDLVLHLPIYVHLQIIFSFMFNSILRHFFFRSKTKMTLHQIVLEHLHPTELFQLFVLAGEAFCVAVDCFLSAFNRLEYSPSSYFRRIVEFQ